MVDRSGRSLSLKEQEGAPLDRLVAALPEIYQPIFGHPGLSGRVTRGCEDRLLHIVQIYKSLEAALNRPLRVLDLGCAQGFFSLNLAKLGAVVYGVDLQDCNIAVCNALAAEHSELKVRFEKRLIEEIVITMAQGQYDLVLGLSVFHHLVHIVGLPLVQTMISVLANATFAGVFELALADEPTQRAHSQPSNPRQLLDGYAFVHEFARHATHLHGDRPLYIASNRYWFLNGQAQAFETWKAESHELSKGSSRGTRRYFFGQGFVVKLFSLDDETFHDINLQEHTSEANFLSHPPADMQVPRLLLYGQHAHEAWLVREQIPGELLLDKIRAGAPCDARIILRDVLEQLTALEAAGLYHNDLRVWNILVGADGRATLIDYGAITGDKKDRGWPYDAFLSFMIVIREIIGGTVAIPDPVRPASFNPESFPEPYNRVLWKLFERSPDQWSFALLRDALLSPSEETSSISEATRSSFARVIEVMEDACKIQQSATRYWRRHAGQTKTTIDEVT